MNKTKEKNFENHVNKCRLCIESCELRDSDKLTTAIEEIFFNLTAFRVRSRRNI